MIKRRIIKKFAFEATSWLAATALIFGVFSYLLVPHAKATLQGDGLLFYAATGNTTPQWRSYSDASNNFSANSGTVAGAQPSIVQVKTSPTKNEAVAAYQDTSGNLRVLCYNGSSWSEDWTIAVAASGTPTTRRFDVAYETTSGDVTVAYSRNTAATNALAYRTKAGSSGCGSANWASAANFPTGTSTTTGTVQWVKATRDRRSSQNLDAFIWADSNSDLGGAIWDGGAFTNFKLLETSLEVASAAQDVDDFDLQYASNSGNLMVVWANSGGTNGTNGVRYNPCTGGTSSCTWSSSALNPNSVTGDDATNLSLSANPLSTSNEMIFVSIGNAGSDLQQFYWSGSAWTIHANIDTACETPAAGTKLVTTGWLTNNGNTKWYYSYDDSTGTTVDYGYGITTASPTVTSFSGSPSLNDIRERYDTDINPFDNSELIMTVSDNTSGIFAYRLSMNTSGTLSWSNMTTAQSWGTLQSVPQEGFKFQYWSYIPTPTFSQSAYEFFANGGTTDVGASLTGNVQDTPATLTSTGEDFRLRLLLHVAANESGTTPAFKLQFAAMSGTCDTSYTGESYADVTAATAIAYHDNTTPPDGAALTTNTNDPHHGSDGRTTETYEELNNFSLITTVPVGTDGMWDFSLIDNGAPSATAYCFRVRYSNDTDIATPTVVPQITTVTPPAGPTTDQVMRGGMWFNSGAKQSYYWAN